MWSRKSAHDVPRLVVELTLLVLLDIGGWAGAMLRLLTGDGFLTMDDVRPLMAR